MSRRGHLRNAYKQRDERGFTLLETLVAITILSLSVAVLFGIFSGGIERTRQDRLTMHARSLAQALLAGIQSAPPLDSSQGTDEAGFLWRLKVTRPAEPQQPQLIPEKVTATVQWHSGGEERTLTLATLAVAPAEGHR